MKKNIDIEDNMDELDGLDKLKSLKGSQSFRVPDSFFKDLESNIISKAQVGQGSKIIKFNTKKVLMYVAAASIVALFIFVALQNFNNNENQPNIANQPTKGIENKNPIANEENYTNKQDLIENHITPNDSLLNEESIAKEENILIEPSQVQENPNINNEENTPIHKIDNIERDQDYAQNSNLNDENINPSSSNPTYTIYNPSNPSNPSSTEDLAIARKQVTNLLDLGADICTNSSALLSVKLNYKSKVSYLWSTEDTTNSILAKESGVYWVNIMDIKGNFLASDSIEVAIIPTPKPDLGEDIEMCNHEAILLSSTCKNSNYKYEWSISDANTPEIYLTNLDPGMQEITIRVISCIDTVSSTVHLTVQDCNLKIPNVMTPNGDGKNDRFIIQGLTFYPNSQLYIMNRNGQVVYESLNYQNDWDARNIPSGTYFYRIKLGDKKNTEKAGTLSIIRN